MVLGPWTFGLYTINYFPLAGDPTSGSFLTTYSCGGRRLSPEDNLPAKCPGNGCIGVKQHAFVLKLCPKCGARLPYSKSAMGTPNCAGDGRDHKPTAADRAYQEGEAPCGLRH